MHAFDDPLGLAVPHELLDRPTAQAAQPWRGLDDLGTPHACRAQRLARAVDHLPSSHDHDDSSFQNRRARLTLAGEFQK